MGKALLPSSPREHRPTAGAELNDSLINCTMEYNTSLADVYYIEFLRIENRNVCLKMSWMDRTASAYASSKLDTFKRTYYLQICCNILKYSNHQGKWKWNLTGRRYKYQIVELYKIERWARESQYTFQIPEKWPSQASRAEVRPKLFSLW